MFENLRKNTSNIAGVVNSPMRRSDERQIQYLPGTLHAYTFFPADHAPMLVLDADMPMQPVGRQLMQPAGLF
ncbi:hypothetical protein [Paenibacillus wulumuqiensis]|uniref:hypothetical protein n=1 Tax=Paenibacillus wulumuqiensis TaxID=1567107 RepID=UPI0012DC82E3|nr:hypothetical protein [Paenibacillus wulumuqiensis]